jgi:Kef-type K+ transport system membrane component KefB
MLVHTYISYVLTKNCAPPYTVQLRFVVVWVVLLVVVVVCWLLLWWWDSKTAEITEKQGGCVCVCVFWCFLGFGVLCAFMLVAATIGAFLLLYVYIYI